MGFWDVFDLERYDKVFIIAIILVSFAIFGCAAPKVKMYPGNKLEDSKHAIIRGDKLEEDSGIVIVKVDNEWTVNPSRGDYFGFPHEVYVLPGKHRLSVKAYYDWGYLEAKASLWLIAEPGGKYVIRAQSKGSSVWEKLGGRVKVWIENELTGQPVGGIVGSDDEPNK